ncbi:MAG TPA: flagellar export chaperone FliS [Vicinamibacterales bacterium]
MSTYTFPGSSMSAASRGAMAYRTVDAQSRSPLELVVMLYDGGIRFVREAREADERKDLIARAVAVSKALAIVGELRSTLNLEEGGELGIELDRLYDYMMSRLLDVTTKRDTSGLPELQRLLTTLREGWAQVTAGQSPPRP